MAKSDLLDEKRVPAEQLRRTIDASDFDFETTESLDAECGTIGQERALEAIKAGLAMHGHGFNIYASGPVGTGRNTTIRTVLSERARDEPTPSDWCYVHNFDQPDQPQTLELPAGRGGELAQDMKDLIEECRLEIPKAFEGEHYHKKRNEALQDLQEKRNELLSDLAEKAKELEHAVQMTPGGVAAVPLKDGEPLSAQEFQELDEETKQELQEKREKVQELISEALAEARRVEKETRQEAEELNQRVGLFAVGHLVEELEEKYSDLPEVKDYLERVKEDIVENIEMFQPASEEEQQVPAALRAAARENFHRYAVNVIVDNSNTEGAPVVDERNPTFYNLLGRIEYRAQLGGMTTDLTMLRGGALLKANAGYLVLQVLDVLRHPFAWEALKRVIRTGEVRIENMLQQYSPFPAATLRPEPIPVSVRVLLVGSPFIHAVLYALDEDFRRLFKIRADFDVEMDLTPEHLSAYAQFASARCREADLPPFSGDGVAAIAEQGARLADDQEKLSTRFLVVTDIVAEAAREAKSDDSDVVNAQHVKRAMQARERRGRLVQDKLQEMILRDKLLVDTEGEVVGQINALAVYERGDQLFGKPTRITCVTYVGRSGVVNIERESEMSGSIHDKGVLIMSGYLAGRFGQDKPLSLSASLCFEQSYAEVDGDSASCAELYVLLSSLSEVPLRQDMAVTGSVNQRGQVQPIGGVNEKIEGFFEVCSERGLSGEHGVLIPRRNVKDLMLRQEVVDAVAEGRFHVYAVETVEEGIEVLTGVPAGRRSEEGKYPEDSVFGKADERLRRMADVLKEFGREPGEDDEESDS